jgi:hypothetical protein
MQTTRLDLPLLAAGQSQKHVTHNEALERLDAIVQLAVATHALAAPPASPVAGERHIVAPGAGGAWSGQGGAIAIADADGAWSFMAPRSGWLAWSASIRRLLAFDGASWRETPETVGSLGVNAAADAQNRMIVAAQNVLFTHEGDDQRTTFNKNVAGDVVSVMFKTGFVGKAEFGLIGDNNLTFKTVNAGGQLTEAIVVEALSGHVGVGKADPTAPLDVNGPVRVGGSTVAGLPPAADVGAGALVFVSNAAGGAVIAFSDGTDWRRVTDRAVVS